jgi:hypothetical protein
MLSAPARRLPGFRFEAQNAPVDEALPRMDVALLVGFAASGPIDVPVAVEQIAEFTEIFGADLPLAWDLRRGEQVYGHLAPSVRTFFNNGGRRCWIVRVAGAGAASNTFALAGLARRGDDGRLRQARATARSEGSWSDSLSVATSIERDNVAVVRIALLDGRLAIDVASASTLSPGDLLRLTFSRQGHVAFGAIKSLTPGSGGLTHLQLESCEWFAAPDATPSGGGVASFASTGGVQVQREALVADVPRWRAGQPVAIDLDLSADDEIPSGTLASVVFGGNELAFIAAGDPDVVAPTPSGRRLRVRGAALWRLQAAPYSAATLPPPAVAERLLLELLVKNGDAEPTRLRQLGLTPAHPRFWGKLPTDLAVYDPIAEPGLAPHDADTPVGSPPRFPLAGDGAGIGVCLPIGDPLVPDYLDAFATALPAAVRDGVGAFDSAVFLDLTHRLIDSRINSLYGAAESLRYQSGREIRRLGGIYAAFFIDDITLVAVPDAVHRRWALADETDAGSASPPHPPPDPPHPEPDCAPSGNFRPCDPCVLGAPSLSEAIDAGGRIALSWTGDGTTFTLEESVGPGFPGWAAIAIGPRQAFDIYDRPPGEYAYRVTAANGALVSTPSNVVLVTVPGRRRAVLDDGPYDDRGLLDVQRALLRVCGARADLVAVLSLPEHYREDDALAHVRSLTSPSIQGGRAGVVAPLSGGEEAAFSYGAIYHPWLIATESSGRALRRVPPEGAACGLLARRALERGAWVAPANQTLNGIVALTPPLQPDRRLDLQTDAINIFRQEPRGFVALSQDTLSRDADLRPLNVRRLLILLRRAALRLGAGYVFEPNDDAFRRMVQRGFEEMLGQMHARGAFAGARASSSFQVVTDTSLNTQRSRDQGRFFVELRVAPSVPLSFLTVRLVQSGDRLTVSEGR